MKCKSRKMRSSLRLQVGEGTSEQKWSLKQNIRKFPQNDEVASKVLSGPGPIDQSKGPPQSKLS
jgi:hypothetical protein